ncbi:MAG TPA: class I SAM-dependent methyltransferase [Streptosporangiaceae bacterium]
MSYEWRWGESNLPLAHLSLLAHTPERLLALRLAMSQAIVPTSAALDAGCGALGVLAIMAARLGAKRVVGVDFGQLPMARKLAEENQVADRVTFLESDLADLDAWLGPFDVIIGMIYNNDPRLDRPQQQLMGQLAERFAHPGTVFIPNRVRYVVTGYDSRTPDPTGHTRRADWGASIDQIEGQTGLTLTAARRLVSPRWRKARLGLEVPPLPPGRLTARSGHPDRSGMTQLTGTEPFTEIGYSRPETVSAYPASLALPITRSGRIDIVIWRQDLLFDDLLIRSTETAQPVEPADTVKPGDTVTLALDDRWNDKVPITVPASGS